MRSACVVVMILGLAGPLGADEVEDLRAVESIRHPEGLQLGLWADSTQVANPVAFTFDARGRMYVCETFRQNKGVEDNRGHMDWLDDDLAAQTVEDRLAYFKKHLKEAISAYEVEEDRITVVADEDGDGRADKTWIFADGFRDALTGTGAGVLVRGDDVYYTCIPKLWMLQDQDGDGAADQRVPLHHGYGVRVAFRGHDSHGLIVGHDGRIYFSIGDRGYNIETADGRTLKDPESGAVFRCEPDGSGLEVFATGLRNPQELAFDDDGNLFTGDNNSDSGDRARMVHLVEGSDAGWRMAFQYLSDRGPWNREKLWHPKHDGQAAYIVPPIINFADGPSGFAYYPGTGLGNEYRGTFFLCDFRGEAVKSGIRSFKLSPHGASFQMTQPQKFLWNVLATDVDFAPDGSMYLTDWIMGWDGIDGGRVVRVSNPAAESSQRVKRVRQLLSRDMTQDKVGAVRQRLASLDRRVRMKAQFELARRGAVTHLEKASQDAESRLARLHATWGLGQILRTWPQARKRTRAQKALVQLMSADDHRVRAAAIESLGDAGVGGFETRIAAALADRNPRVRSYAAIAAGKLKVTATYEPLLTMIAENDDRDAVLRHAGVMGLVGAASEQQLRTLREDGRAPVRLAAVLALRRHAAPSVAEFLRDSNPLVSVEAARAIHDVPIKSAFPRLAEMLEHPTEDEALLRRALNAHYHLGEDENAQALVRYVVREDAVETMQLEAIEMLRRWRTPSGRDRVLGMWRPIPQRSVRPAQQALRDVLAKLERAPRDVMVSAARAASELGVEEAGPVVHQMVLDDDYSPDARAELLRALVALDYVNLEEVVRRSLLVEVPKVRAAARQLLIKFDVEEALRELFQAAVAENRVERQAAFASLAELDRRSVEKPLVKLIQSHLLTGKLPTDSHLDVVLAARKQGGAAADALQPFLQQLQQQPLGEDRLTLNGGNVQRGKRLFHENLSLSCLRCHRVGEDGGRVGPNLAGIGKTKDPAYLLESIIDPNKQIAEGFGTVVVLTEEGLQYQGILQSETNDKLFLIDAEGKRFHVDKSEILVRRQGKSAMPEDLRKFLNPFELRDLIAYLDSLKTPWVEETGHEE